MGLSILEIALVQVAVHVLASPHAVLSKGTQESGQVPFDTCSGPRCASLGDRSRVEWADALLELGTEVDKNIPTRAPLMRQTSNHFRRKYLFS